MSLTVRLLLILVVAGGLDRGFSQSRVLGPRDYPLQSCASSPATGYLRQCADTVTGNLICVNASGASCSPAGTGSGALTGSASFAFGSAIASGACGTGGTVTVTGAAVGDAVSIGASPSPVVGMEIFGKVTALSTVTVEACNHTGSSVTPASATYFLAVTHNSASVKVGQNARQFNGMSDYLNSASALTYGGTGIVSVSMFVWWNAFTNGDSLVGESSTNFNSNVGAYLINLDASSGMAEFDMLATGPTYFTCRFTRPSAAAWHHYLIVADLRTATNICKVYIDGLSVTPNLTVASVAQTFLNATQYFFSRAGTSLFGAGRLSEFAIWEADESANAAALSSYTAASSIDSTNLLYYWPIRGASPEVATTGGINLTVNGTTVVSGPNP